MLVILYAISRLLFLSIVNKCIVLGYYSLLTRIGSSSVTYITIWPDMIVTKQNTRSRQSVDNYTK